MPSRKKLQSGGRLAALGLLIVTVFILPIRGAAKELPKVDLMLKGVDGQRARLRDYRGKIVVLNFWATWCGPCNAEIPMLVEAEKEYASRGVVFVAASLDDAKTKRNIPDFISKYDIKFPVWTDATGDDLAKLGMGEAVPATAFLDQEGHILARVLGQMRKEEMKERLDWLTGDRTGPAPQPVVRHLEGK